MFRSRCIKHARLLIRHAEKLMRYRCDVLSETALAEIRQQIEALERAIKGRDLPAVQQNSERLDAVEQKYLFFFTWSRIITDRGTHRVYAPEATLAHDFQVAPGARYKRGQIIARGAIDTGDQVFVDKFTYNFMKPHRGDVFVFRT